MGTTSRLSGHQDCPDRTLSATETDNRKSIISYGRASHDRRHNRRKRSSTEQHATALLNMAENDHYTTASMVSGRQKAVTDNKQRRASRSTSTTTSLPPNTAAILPGTTSTTALQLQDLLLTPGVAQQLQVLSGNSIPAGSTKSQAIGTAPTRTALPMASVAESKTISPRTTTNSKDIQRGCTYRLRRFRLLRLFYHVALRRRHLLPGRKRPPRERNLSRGSGHMSHGHDHDMHDEYDGHDRDMHDKDDDVIAKGLLGAREYMVDNDDDDNLSDIPPPTSQQTRQGH